MKKQKGITLIALIITIIVMLILVAVVINFATNDNGIISNAKIASERTRIETDRESLQDYVLGEDVYDAATGDVNLGNLKAKLESAGWTVTNRGTELEVIGKESKKTFTITQNGKIIIGQELNPDITLLKKYFAKRDNILDLRIENEPDPGNQLETIQFFENDEELIPDAHESMIILEEEEFFSMIAYNYKIYLLLLNSQGEIQDIVENFGTLSSDTNSSNEVEWNMTLVTNNEGQIELNSDMNCDNLYKFDNDGYTKIDFDDVSQYTQYIYIWGLWLSRIVYNIESNYLFNIEDCSSLKELQFEGEKSNFTLVRYMIPASSNDILEEVILPECTKKIEGIFEYCTALTNITIPSNVTSIDDGVFRTCDNLNIIKIEQNKSDSPLKNNITEWLPINIEVTVEWNDGSETYIDRVLQ